MVAISGFLADTGHEFVLDTSGRITAALNQYTVDYWPGHYNEIAGSNLVGSITRNFPVSVVPRVISGFGFAEGQLSFLGDYYNRLVLDPVLLNVGAVVASVSYQVKLWNAWLIPAELISIDSENDTGVTISLTPPVVFDRIEQKIITVNIDIAGPASIAASFTFNFLIQGAAYSVTLNVTGVRGSALPGGPAWNGDYTITYEFKTDIVTSRSGKEQRRALRQTARKTVEYSAQYTRDNLLSFRRNTWANQWRSFIIPEMTRNTAISFSTTPGDESILITGAAPQWMAAGSTVILLAGGSSEVLSVLSVDDNVISLNSPVSGTWAVGTRIYPGLIGRLPNSFGQSHVTTMAATVDVTFTIDPGSEAPYDPGEPVYSFRGVEVFARRPNWSTALTITSLYPTDVIDFGQGRVDNNQYQTFGTETTQASFLGVNRDKTEYFIQVFTRCLGRARPLFWPTWERDFIVVPASGPAFPINHTIRVQGTEVSELLGDSTVYRNVAVQWIDGTYSFFELVSMTVVSDEVGNDTLLNFTADDVGHTYADIKWLCWMPLCRFASDALSVVWHTDTVAELAISRQTLEDTL